MTTASPISPTTLLPPDVVAALPWEDLHGVVGAGTRVLWRDAGSMSGVLRLQPGARLAEHVHDRGHHHVYVLSGRCRMSGLLLDTGSYAHVPAGQRHGLACDGDAECQLLYLYLERPSA